MKYIKYFEFRNNRKFKSGDWIKHKFINTELPLIVDMWSPLLNEYKVYSVKNKNRYFYIKSIYYELMTQDEIDNWKIKNDIEKYNL